jgi:hypothetical protein
VQINVSYDSSVDSAPVAFKVAVAYTVSLLDAAFTNDVTLNLHVGWGEVGRAPLIAGDLGTSEEAQAPAYSYATIRNALVANGTAPDQLAANSTLPATDPTGGGTFDIGTAEAKALGLIAGNAPGIDGWVGFDNTASDWSFDPTATPGPNQYYLVGTIEHEITEVMGRDSMLGVNGEHYSNGWGTPDLFRFSAPGVRQLAPGPGHTTGYFSIDNGLTNLGSWNNHVARGDLGDWDLGFGSGGGPGPDGNDAFNDFSNPGVLNQITQNDLTLMQVLGWNPSQPDNFVINGEVYFVASVDTANDLVVLPGGTVDVDPGGTVNGLTIASGFVDLADGASSGTAPIIFEGPGGTLKIESATAPENVIRGFVAGDTIDFSGAPVGASPTVKLLAGNLLSITEHNKTYQLQFDPGDNFTGQSFHVTGDGHGGTLIFIDPGVLSVTTSGAGISAGTGDLDAGHVVTLTLNTNEAINIDTTLGTPTLTLSDGATASYTGGSGSNALNFQYTVAAGENAADLAVTAFHLNGATADDANGHAAVFTGALGNPGGTLQIDTTAPHVTGITASPADGIENVGSAISFVVGFDEAVGVAGGTPSLTLNDGGNAIYDAAATAALHDATKLAFDYLVSGSEPPTPSLAVTGFNPNSPTVADLAGNPADLTGVAASFSSLSVNDAPAYTINGFTRPELHFNSAGDIILDAPALAAAAAYGVKFLYAGLPESTLYPPVADTHDFHLLT